MSIRIRLAIAALLMAPGAEAQQRAPFATPPAPAQSRPPDGPVAPSAREPDVPAQPFDMGGPRPLPPVRAAPVPDRAPPVQERAAPAAAPAMRPGTAERPASAAQNPGGAAVPSQPPAVPVLTTGATGTAVRPILPVEKLRLEGEMDARSWSVFLTQEEAVSETTLTVSFTNAVVVMPEASRLKVSLNGEVVFEAPVASPGGVATSKVPVRRNLLRPGQNRVKVEASQRHRTDCTVDATYELWTQLEGSTTGLAFATVSQNRMRTLDDLPAVGADATGTTTLRLIAPGPPGAQVADRLLRAVQAIAIRGRYQHLVVKLADAPEPAAAGTLTLAIGTAAELRDRIESLPQEAASRAFVGFVREPRQGSATIVISGPSPSDVEAAVETLAAPTQRPAGVIRTEIDTAAWRAPDAPLVASERSIRLSNLDLGTQEFSGRRFKTDFAIGLPADFYADAYGEAILYLDAAYAQAVRPGSHLDVYVNGRITSTLALNGARGGIFQRFPLKLPLRNFKAGVNEVVIEAALLTDSDAQCLPGATVPGPNRFVLFDTTELKFDNFGRIGRDPDLAAFSAAAFPYLLATAPVPVILGRHDAPHYSAAATLLAKLAHSAGRPVRADTGVTILSVGNREALFVGTAGQLPPSLLPAVGIADATRTTWPNAVEAPTVLPSDSQPYESVVDRFRERQPSVAGPIDDVPVTGTEEIRDRWRRSLGDNALRREFTSFEDWLKRTFEISFSSFSPFQAASEPYEPAPQTTVVLAQGDNPQGGASWTVLVGRKEDVLESGIARLTEVRTWQSLSGQLAAYQAQTQRLDTRAPTRITFIETRPFSLMNTRQIVANWLSTNQIFYAVGLLGLCTALGMTTSVMLKEVGRR